MGRAVEIRKSRNILVEKPVIKGYLRDGISARMILRRVLGIQFRAGKVPEI
jgi:hypothetical protein